MSPPIGTNWGAEQVYLDRFWATFVQFEVSCPASCAIGAAHRVLGRARLCSPRRPGGTAAAGRAARRWRSCWCAAVILEVLALHAAAFRSLLDNPADPVITGRYLLPLVPLFGRRRGCCADARCRAASRRWPAARCWRGAFLLQLSAFGLIVAQVLCVGGRSPVRWRSSRWARGSSCARSWPSVRDIPAEIPSPAALREADTVPLVRGHPVCFPYAVAETHSQQAQFKVSAPAGPAGELRLSMVATDDSGYRSNAVLAPGSPTASSSRSRSRRRRSRCR